MGGIPLEAQCRTLLGPLDANIDTAAERFGG
jgi:hypothetical protein